MTNLVPESEQQYGSILTVLGENAEQNGKLLNKQIEFTHIAFGDANDTYVQPDRKAQGLVNELHRIPVNSVDVLQATPDSVPILKVEALLPDDVNDVVIREFAAVATFNGQSYFHAIGNCARVYVPRPINNGNVSNPVTLEMTFVITSAEPIVEIDPTVITASREWVSKQMFTRTQTYSSFGDIAKNKINATHIITRGYYKPGDKGGAEFVYTGKLLPDEAGKSYLNLGLAYDADGREFEITSSPLNYRQFGAVLDGKTRTMKQIKDCHDCANLKKIPVVNEDGQAFIDDSHLVILNTNVDWGMTEFIIDPEVGNPATWTMPVLFTALGNPLESFELPLNKSEFYESSSWVPSLSTLHNAFIFIESNLPHIKRSPGDASYHNKREPNRVVKNGELNKPLRFDYRNAGSLTVKYRNIEECYITIKGGFLNQNGSPSHVFLDIARNNVIWHLIGIKDKTNSDALNIRAPMRISMCADVRLIDVNAEAPTRIEGREGTYGLSGTGVVDLYLENLNAYCGYGFAGMNLINGVTLKSCKINRFDGHFGIWDIFAEDTHFKEWGILVGSGGGYLKLKNCSKFFARSTKLNMGLYGFSDVIQFRPDYAAEWRGSIEVDGLTLIVDSSMPVTNILQIIKFHSNGDYGANHIVDWGRNITVKNVVIEAPTTHLDNRRFGVVCVDFSEKGIATGTRLPARIVVDNVNYSGENPKAYISAINGPDDVCVKMNVEVGDAVDGAHNAVWAVSNIFNANRNPFYQEGTSPGYETLVQYGPVPVARNQGDDRIKLRLLITNCTMFDVELTIDHYMEVHGGSCVAYDSYSGDFATSGVAWFHGCQIMPLPIDSTGNPEFGYHHLRGCTIMKTVAGYNAWALKSAQGTLCENGVVVKNLSNISWLFYGYFNAADNYQPVSLMGAEKTFTYRMDGGDFTQSATLPVNAVISNIEKASFREGDADDLERVKTIKYRELL